MRRRAAQLALQLLVVAVLVAILQLVSAPSPALFGVFLGSAALSIAGMRVVEIPPLASRAAQGVLGVMIATLIDAEQLRRVGADLPLLIGASILIIAVSVALGQMLTRRGVSWTTATLASVAGAASSIVSMADELGADRRVVAVVQYLRVLLVLGTLVVVLAGAGSGSSASVTSTPSADGDDVVFMALAVACGVAVSWIRFVPAPALLGSLVGGVLLSVTPAFAGATVPEAAGFAAFAVIGAQAASGFTRETFRSLRAVLPMAMASSVLLIALCAVIGLGYSMMTGTSRLDGYLATSPGGLPVVLAAVVETGGDAAVVSSGQLIRLLAVVILTPIVIEGVRHWRHMR